MYDYLEGDVAARTAARVVLDVAGVGYEMLVPLGMSIPSAGRVRIWTHLAVREDAHTLYGFPDRETRELFRVLLGVRGVGPAMALGVLSGLGRDELVEAILNEDLQRLTRIKGVGKKTAEQMLLDLRDKAAQLVAGADPARGAPAGEGNIQDAITALASVGYSDKEARKLVEHAAGHVDPSDLERLVRTALQP